MDKSKRHDTTQRANSANVTLHRTYAIPPDCYLSIVIILYLKSSLGMLAVPPHKVTAPKTELFRTPFCFEQPSNSTRHQKDNGVITTGSRRLPTK